jgi:hypothetical protein
MQVKMGMVPDYDIIRCLPLNTVYQKTYLMLGDQAQAIDVLSVAYSQHISHSGQVTCEAAIVAAYLAVAYGCERQLDSCQEYLATAQDILLLHPQQVEFSFTFEIQVSHGT